jgi:hypothetical protein
MLTPSFYIFVLDYVKYINISGSFNNFFSVLVCINGGKINGWFLEFSKTAVAFYESLDSFFAEVWEKEGEGS